MFKPYHRSPAEIMTDARYIELLQSCTAAKVEGGPEKNITQRWRNISKSYLEFALGSVDKSKSNSKL